MEKKYKKILVVGATSRNLGKTTLLCKIITRFCANPITAIKIKTLRDNDEGFHGRNSVMEGPYIVRKEQVSGGMADTDRLFKAGARKVLYIKSKVQALPEAFSQAMQLVPDDHFLVIESNSLVECIDPGIYILIKGKDPSLYKPSSITTEDSADLVIFSDGTAYSSNPDDLPIATSTYGWEIKSQDNPISEF